MSRYRYLFLLAFLSTVVFFCEEKQTTEEEHFYRGKVINNSSFKLEVSFDSFSIFPVEANSSVTRILKEGNHAFIAYKAIDSSEYTRGNVVVRADGWKVVID